MLKYEIYSRTVILYAIAEESNHLCSGHSSSQRKVSNGRISTVGINVSGLPLPKLDSTVLDRSSPAADVSLRVSVLRSDFSAVEVSDRSANEEF